MFVRLFFQRTKKCYKVKRCAKQSIGKMVKSTVTDEHRTKWSVNTLANSIWAADSFASLHRTLNYISNISDVAFNWSPLLQ